MKKDTKKMKKMLGYGLLIVIPIVFVLAYLFAKVKMSDILSIFLIVLISGCVIFVYYLLFTHLQSKKEEKNKDKPDPFAD